MTLELRVIIRHLGMLLLVLSGVLAAVATFALGSDVLRGLPDHSHAQALLYSAACGLLLACLLIATGRSSSQQIGQREALLLVGLAWLGGAAVSALPYRFWAGLRPDAAETPHAFDSFLDCFFEAMSGLTTTGATILESIGTVPDSLLLWRALTQWLGGLGIVVLFVAVLPMLGVGGRRIYRLEAPGPTHEGVKPRIRDTARTLWLMYVGLTVAEIIALKTCGMSWFDSLCHTFTTLATGGFSTFDASIAGFDQTSIHVVIIVFMFLAGVNFGIYYRILQGRWRGVGKDPELRLYIGILLAATVIVTSSLLSNPPEAYVAADGTRAPLGIIIRDALFQVVSVQTTTGFATADFDTWGFSAKATLMLLMFVGASAGSTGGGMKVSRILIVFKVILTELEHVYRPHVVRTTKMGRTTIHPDLKLNTLVFVVLIAVTFGAGTAALMAFETDLDITTAATASVATLNNIGPGLARVGATQNYAWFSPESKLVMTSLMVLGRLEVFAILALFMPRFWREE